MTEAETAGPLIPEYASITMRRAGVSVMLFRLAVFFAVLPLTVGLVILLLYWMTRNDILPVLGLLTIVGGVAAAGISALLLAIFAWQARNVGRSTFLAWRKRIGLAAALLVMNVPAAFACAAIGQRLMSTAYVTVRNGSPTRVDSFRIEWSKGAKDLGPILPGETVKTSFVLAAEGDITFRQVRNGIRSEGTLDAYTDSTVAPELKVVISAAGVMVNGSPADPIDPDR